MIFGNTHMLPWYHGVQQLEVRCNVLRHRDCSVFPQTPANVRAFLDQKEQEYVFDQVLSIKRREVGTSTWTSAARCVREREKTWAGPGTHYIRWGEDVDLKDVMLRWLNLYIVKKTKFTMSTKRCVQNETLWIYMVKKKVFWIFWQFHIAFCPVDSGLWNWNNKFAPSKIRPLQTLVPIMPSYLFVVKKHPFFLHVLFLFEAPFSPSHPGEIHRSNLDRPSWLPR